MRGEMWVHTRLCAPVHNSLLQCVLSCAYEGSHTCATFGFRALASFGAHGANTWLHSNTPSYSHRNQCSLAASCAPSPSV